MTTSNAAPDYIQLGPIQSGDLSITVRGMADGIEVRAALWVPQLNSAAVVTLPRLSLETALKLSQHLTLTALDVDFEAQKAARGAKND